MSTNGNRLDRIEKVRPSEMNPMPTHWEIRAEIDRMESNPKYKSRWTSRQVRHWIDQATMTNE